MIRMLKSGDPCPFCGQPIQTKDRSKLKSLAWIGMNWKAPSIGVDTKLRISDANEDERLIKARTVHDNGDVEYTVDIGKVKVNWCGTGFLRRILDRLWELEQDGWISVKDRLPEKNDQYLCCFYVRGQYEVRFMTDLTYYATEKMPHFQHTLDGNEIEVTHWMPLPEFPKEPI